MSNGQLLCKFCEDDVLLVSDIVTYSVVAVKLVVNAFSIKGGLNTSRKWWNTFLQLPGNAFL